MINRFIEFATQNTDNGEINTGFHDIKTGEWYYTKDSENAKKICQLLNELFSENKSLKQQLESEHQMLDNAILLERTRMGQNALKQYKEAIQ